MAGVLVFYVRTAGGWLAAQRLRGRGTMPAPEEWQKRLRALAARLRLTRPVILLESCLAETPVVIGFLRPAILIPAGLITGIAPDQLEAILMHELAHVRRHDYAVNVMQSLVEGLLFFHPAVWWLSGVVRAERESCCDDAVVALRGDAAGYAAALTALEQRRSVGKPALAARGGNLMQRVRRLVEPDRPRSIAGLVLGACLLLVSIGAGLSAVQPKTVPTGAAPPAIAMGPFVRAAAPEPAAARPESPALLAQARPPRPGAEAQLRTELAAPYRKWVDEDVVYIIAKEEQAAFDRLLTDEERERFIEQFWLRRDPTPGTQANEFKEEHYRRIAYANEHFASGLPGWKTDRGRIYIVYGRPETILDDFLVQTWSYWHIDGLGDNVWFQFTKTGESGGFVLAAMPGPKTTFTSQSGLAFQVEVGEGTPSGSSTRVASISIPTRSTGHTVDVYGRITNLARRRVSVFEDTISPGQGEGYHKSIPLAPGRYQANIIVKDLTTGAEESGELGFEVK
jgi:GWxTD domain-containing protein